MIFLIFTGLCLGVTLGCLFLSIQRGDRLAKVLFFGMLVVVNVGALGVVWTNNDTKTPSKYNLIVWNRDSTEFNQMGFDKILNYSVTYIEDGGITYTSNYNMETDTMVVKNESTGEEKVLKVTDTVMVY